MSGIDLNSDVGEFSGSGALQNDAVLFQHISSANIACGYHAGDASVIRETCRVAVKSGVVIGAHPSYRDREGFGRRFIEVPRSELTNDLVAQIGTVQALARVEAGEVRYVKPHGALYNAIVYHEAHATAVVDAIRSLDERLILVVPPASLVRQKAEAAGIRTVVEAFADRAYTPEGLLVPRTEPEAIIVDSQKVVEQVMELIEGRVTAVDGTRIRVDAETICLHGDTPGAVSLSGAIADFLRQDGVDIRSFVDQ